MSVGVLNYGVGNLGSVMRSLEELMADPILINDPCEISNAHSIILPGVGGFAECKKILDSGGWSDAILKNVIDEKKPILGICLGMQLLADVGDEGGDYNKPVNGLGLVSGRITALGALGCYNKIPHIGWNSVSKLRNDMLLDGIPNGTDFYFVHSYAFEAKCKNTIIAHTDYGINIIAAISENNIWGTQFHPEKSSRAGRQVLKNFVSYSQCSK